ncbi:MAG TPA: DNA polymerase III subunit delta [Verrucomicrobiae bacterium]|nr:DNA polymerase III subunit delta [Verrucomicrobiae bacterium]
MARPAAAVSSVPAPVCLIQGDDDFAVKQRARQLFQQWSEELGGMDHETIDAQVNNAGEALRAVGRLREALQTLPFFGSGKVVWLQNCNFLGDDRTASSEAVGEALADLAQTLKAFPWQNVRLIISAGKVDKRKTFFKTIEKLGNVEAFEAWSIDDKDWATQAELAAAKAIRARKKNISDDALAELVQNVGPHNQQLANEIEKLCLYAGERADLTVDDVNAIVTRNKQARSFALAEALGDRSLQRVLRCLDQELWELQFDKKKSTIGLLYGLISKVRGMLLLKEMIREGWIKADADYNRFKTQLERVPAEKLPEDKKFNPLSMHPYMLHKSLPQTRNYTTAELVRAMEVLLVCNQRLVSSSLDDALVLQQTLVRIIKNDEANDGRGGGRASK